MRSFILFLLIVSNVLPASGQSLRSIIDNKSDAIESKVIDWRRDLHQFPELSNREVKTAAKVAKHLQELGLEVQTKIAYTGVVGILETGKPGPVVALRADMDALPVVERVDLPFASKEKTTYLGKEVGIMHACGHDTHVAILMGVAEILSGMKEQLNGKLIFIFQPAEEGAPPEEGGGAKMMVEQGVLSDHGVDVIFGLHINSKTEVGKIKYRAGGLMAAADVFNITINGKQTHGSQPWAGVDPITIGAQVVMGLQTIISRQTELTKEAAVISVGKFDAGVRNNIIPEKAELTGTIRTLDIEMQDIIHEKITKTATAIAEAGGATADVEIIKGVPVTFNHIELTREMLPTILETAGEENVIVSPAITGAEDFSFYANEVPALFFFLGGMPKGMSSFDAAPHHTPDFFIDESGMKLGLRTLCNLAIDYLSAHP